MSTARRVDKLRARGVALHAPRGQSNRTIVVAGDSLCTGRAPAMLAQRLKTSGVDVGIVVVARGGILIDQLTPMMAGYDPGNRQGAVVGAIILIGGNHAKQGHEPTQEGIMASMRRCLETARARWPLASAIVCTIPVPTAHPELRTDASHVTSVTINPAIRAVAAACGAILCELETVFEGIPGARSDGVHPTAAGDRLLAERWFQAAQPHVAPSLEP